MRFIQNLALWQKFALLGGLALILILPLAGRLVHDQWRARTVAVHERDAIPAVGALLRLVRNTQVHRGLTAGAKSGNERAAERRPDQAQRVERDLSDALAAVGEQLHEAGNLRADQLRTHWEALRADVDSGEISGADSFKRHNHMVQTELRLVADLADSSGLSMDPDPVGMHLVALVTERLPRITELLGQARAQGASAITKGEVTPAQRALLEGHVARIAQLLADSERHFEQAFAHDAGVSAALQAPRASAAEAAQQAIAKLREQVLDPDAPVGDASAFFGELTGLIDLQFKLADTSFEQLDAMLDGRVTAAQRTLVASLVAIVLAVLIGAGVMVATARGASHSVRVAQRALEALANGDLTHRLPTTAGDESGLIARQIGVTMQELARMVGEIKSAGGVLGAASVQIASGNADLASRTQSSSASLQEAAASLHEINSAVHQNAENAREAASLAGEASEVAVNGGALIGRLVNTMEEISQSSQRISDITGVIDSIAFQTNILALNAAVEAQRAGEQGRGFAVVASEVRALAQRSADAAREIKDLIGRSVTTVESGHQLVGDTRKAIQSIVDQSRVISNMVEEIGQATGEQAQGISQVSEAVSGLEQNTQQNAAMVEESSAAVDSLRGQAETLVQMVDRFKVAQA